LHLAELLSTNGQFTQALDHVEVVIREIPDSVEALTLATRIALALGDPRAGAWSRLRDALDIRSSSTDFPSEVSSPLMESNPSSASFKPIAHGPGDVPSDDDWDRLLGDLLRESGRPARVALDDVGGLADVKSRLKRSFLAPLQNPELREAYGASLRGGLLLWGPPGCGKSFLARAMAGELGAHFLSVGLNEVLDMWFGNSEKQLHELFSVARRSSPCVLFFDEVDAIGHSRMNLGRSPARNVVAQLLVELDGVEYSNEGVFVIGATNQPWDVDPALRRPGRFDRTMLVLPPDVEARASIFAYHLRGRPLGDIDYVALARASDGLSGADIRLVCEEAAERALGLAIDANVVVPIGTADVLGALSSVTPSTSAWLDAAQNHVRYANASGEYDELAKYLTQRRKGRPNG
jgi:SpoVK/Ycf46/Vps4 family AAA+-type ATPase